MGGPRHRGCGWPTARAGRVAILPVLDEGLCQSPGAILFRLLGWFIYSTVSGTRLFSEANTRPEGVNVFELALLEPIGPAGASALPFPTWAAVR
jgi:hypothetical protein